MEHTIRHQATAVPLVVTLLQHTEAHKAATKPLPMEVHQAMGVTPRLPMAAQEAMLAYPASSQWRVQPVPLFTNLQTTTASLIVKEVRQATNLAMTQHPPM